MQDFGSLHRDISDYDPGEAYYEVLSLDVYEGFTYDKYEIIKNAAGAKPFAIGECAELPDANRLANENHWSFWMSWSELTFQWPNTEQSIRAVFNSNQAITLDEMPGDWTEYQPTPETTSALRSFHNTYLVRTWARLVHSKAFALFVEYGRLTKDEHTALSFSSHSRLGMIIRCSRWVIF